MKISVIIGHPNKKSFNYAIAETVVNRLSETGHEVFSHNLADSTIEQRKEWLKEVQRIVNQHFVY